MRLIFGLIGLILVCGNLSAKTGEPIIAVLYEDLEHKTQFSELPKYEECWDENGELIPGNCTKTVTSCHTFDRYTAKNQHRLKIYFDEKLHNQEKIYFSIPTKGKTDIWEKRFEIGKRYDVFPWESSLYVVAGEDVVVFTEEKVGYFKVLGRYVIDSSLELRIKSNDQKRVTYKFELGEGWFDTNKIIPKELYEAGSLATYRNKFEIELPADDRVLELIAYRDGQFYEAKVSLANAKNSSKMLASFKLFKEITMNSWLGEYKDIHQSFKHDVQDGYEQPDEEKAYLSLDSIKIKDKDLDIKKYFELKNGDIVLRDREKFNELVSDYTSFEIEIRGDCGVLFKKNLRSKIEIKDSPKGKVLGHLQVYFARGFMSEYLDINKKESQDFRVNLKTSLDALYHQVSEVKEGEVNLGSGPWGEKGWASVRSDRLFDDRVYFFEDAKSENTFEYYRTYKGKVYQREVPWLEPGRLSLYSGRKYEVPSEKYLDENGILKNEISYVFDRSASSANIMVDLTDGRLFLGGKEKKIETNVYLKPDPEALVVGTLQFERDGKKLKGSYLAKSAKTPKPFAPNSYIGRCGYSVYFFAVHKTIKVFQDFSSLGKGPWGGEAWVRTKHFNPSVDIPRFDEELADIKSRGFNSDNWNSVCEEKPARDFEEGFEPMFVNLVSHDLQKNNNEYEDESKDIKTFTAVYSEAKVDSKKLGDIEIVYPLSNNSFNVEVLFRNPDNSRTEFDLDLYSGLCSTQDGERRSLLLSVLETKNGWSNIGSGDWGDIGWINEAPDYLFRTKYRFQVPGVSSGEIRSFENGRVLFSPSASYYEDFETAIPIRDLIDSEGRFRYKLDCEGGC